MLQTKLLPDFLKFDVFTNVCTIHGETGEEFVRSQIWVCQNSSSN